MGFSFYVLEFDILRPALNVLKISESGFGIFTPSMKISQCDDPKLALARFLLNSCAFRHFICNGISMRVEQLRLYGKTLSILHHFH